MTGVNSMAVEHEMAECPGCCGNGVLFVERLFGRNAPEPYRTKTCGACGGTGEVSADAVKYCVECQAPAWVAELCTHQLGDLCPDHRAPCVECTGVRGDR
jgi:DnaJ-class molecular chaperone